MGRAIARWAKEHIKKNNKTYLEKDGKIYVFSRSNDDEPEAYRNWEDYMSYNANTMDLHDLSQYKQRKHHLRRR